MLEEIMQGMKGRKHTRERRGLIKEEVDLFKYEGPPGHKYVKRRLHQLSLAEKVDICHEVIVEKMAYDDIARQHRVAKSLITYLMGRVRKNKDYIQDLKQESDRRQDIVGAIKDATNEILDKDAHILNAA